MPFGRGLETQRQCSDPALARTGRPLGPALLWLFSLVVLMGHAPYPDQHVPVPQAAWYAKTHASLHALLALVRRRIGRQYLFQTSPVAPDLRLIPPSHWELLLFAVCY